MFCTSEILLMVFLEGAVHIWVEMVSFKNMTPCSHSWHIFFLGDNKWAEETFNKYGTVAVNI